MNPMSLRIIVLTAIFGCLYFSDYLRAQAREPDIRIDTYGNMYSLEDVQFSAPPPPFLVKG